jgi:hypothetical protein
MHKVTEKRGHTTVTHHVGHVKEGDGSSKHVYLGTDSDDAIDRLIELKVSRIKSCNKLITEMETVQEKLGRVGYYNRSYDDIMSDIISRHHQEKHFDRLVSADEKPKTPFSNYFMLALGGLALGGAGYFAFSDPNITGAVVKGTEYVIGSSVFWIAAGVLATSVLLGVGIHAAVHRHEHRHDDFKPPLPPENQDNGNLGK